MSIKEHREQMRQNRSTLYHFLKDKLDMRMMKIGKGTYKVFQVPYDWDNSYLIINDTRITDFQALIIFTNELVVRFGTYDDAQINIPYKSIKDIQLARDLDIGYQELHLNK